MVISPYSGLPEEDWLEKTIELVSRHPLETDEIRAVVLGAWNDIFDSKLGPNNFQIGRHIFPKPQIMGFLLHELIPLEFGSRYPGTWKGETTAGDKDLVYIPDDLYSIEIKTSSHPSQVFGNRSYAQVGKGPAKKSKSGYYLTVNFGKFGTTDANPKILKIRFGWLDHSDWIGQAAASGQQAHLSGGADRSKLLAIYPCE